MIRRFLNWLLGALPHERLEVMWTDDDGWSEWVHPAPGYRLQCCDCGLVHIVEFEISTNQSTATWDFHPGETPKRVILFRLRRE